MRRTVQTFRSVLILAAACAASVPFNVGQAFAEDGARRAISRPAGEGAETLRKAVPDNGEAGSDANGVKKGGRPDVDLYPSSGVTLYQRMGSILPPLPPEKPYTGPIDEAFGAYQRGLYELALKKALPRAEAGDAAAQTLVAEMMVRGQGLPQDTQGAVFWYGEAAKRGDPAAMFQYALVLMDGRYVARDKAKADDYMRRAAEAGNSSAQFNWAQILVSDHPGESGLKMALPFYEKAAAQGVADAQYAVAQLYVAIKDLPAEKKAKARDWLLRAAKAGYDTAQLDMGVWYVNGVGGDKDYEQGFNWLRIAALRGNVVAQNKLAHLYIYALGTRPNPVEAAKWYVLSRRAGLSDPELEDFYLGINDDQQKQAIDAANKFRRSGS
ncbi:tetratricopeptide repeat protein [Rhizobium oryzicola]|uniref:Tetratricopeptide repeat protein n=1 Tax=Rhizobium oryzicola TaxID=1232668 RepID=A0ABT8SU92_9HYPH|nr:tetratricopeptide repeat protein [Rhizobium oryzicola]MDO1582014.1 tetratricopeptide repeat protein [Rhizobium oryzicola]